MSHIYEAEVGERSLIIETGRLANQASGSTTVALGETVVLVTACASPEPRTDIDFFPLTIDFEERLYAVGKIPGAFMRREGRPSTDAVLAGRMTDRALRPLFPKGFRNDVQIIVTVLSADPRADGRAVDELRPITCDVGILPRTHGTGLFQRGETQVLSVVTLGPMSMQQKLDTLSPEEKKRFMHHYNFPPFSVGEVRRLGGTGRREIGHGALGERALQAVVPGEDEFPYTIRLVSEVLSSNGSTSQASICGGSLALMDAGVPIKEAVAGVAMGLVTGERSEEHTSELQS